NASSRPEYTEAQRPHQEQGCGHGSPPDELLGRGSPAVRPPLRHPGRGRHRPRRRVHHLQVRPRPARDGPPGPGAREGPPDRDAGEGGASVSKRAVHEPAASVRTTPPDPPASAPCRQRAWRNGTENAPGAGRPASPRRRTSPETRGRPTVLL